MFKLEHLTIKNFLSVGNVTQAIDFNQNDLTLVLGENLDTGGSDKGSRNGVGKSTLTHALSYALFGQALTKIKVDNLINAVNGKDMLVTLTFKSNGNSYRIERGRKPTVFRYWVNDVEQDENDAQGESRETQHEILAALQMNHLMYKNIISLNTYTLPFLSMSTSDQREIIENLLGVTLLSEKAEQLKKQIKESKDLITKESATIEATIAANKKIQESIDKLIESQRRWASNKEAMCLSLAEKIASLQEVDIDNEIKNHNILKQRSDVKYKLDNLIKQQSTLESSLRQADKTVKKIESDIKILKSNKCPMCDQGLHSDTHSQLLDKNNTDLLAANSYLNDIATQYHIVSDELDKEQMASTSLFKDNITTVYRTLSDAQSHQNNLNKVLDQLEAKYNEQDPYASQVTELQSSALSTIDYDTINELTRLKEHQDFLLKMLTNKDSYVRKNIIDQNLNYLNKRLSYYLDKMNLPHLVTFLNDLSVEILYLGQDIDFHNLSRGEMTRVSLSLSWAFRDVWENIYQPINLMFIDEVLDSGLDSSGAEDATQVLRHMIYERNKNIFLISHKEELTSKVSNVLKAVKERGFTSYYYEE